MHEIFSNLTKAGKKDFNKLSNKEKAEIIHANVVDKISEPLRNAVVNATINGMDMAYEQIYKEFVEVIDSTNNKDTQNATINSLLSTIRLKHLEYEQKRIAKGKGNDNNETD